MDYKTNPNSVPSVSVFKNFSILQVLANTRKIFRYMKNSNLVS